MRRTFVLATALALLAAACSQPGAKSADALSAQPTEIASAAPPSAAPPTALVKTDTPPLENGLYAARGACPFEGCATRMWKATAEATLLERPNASARTLAKIPVGEWVDAVESVSYLTPMRGVVVRDNGDLKAGDVIYQLEGEGEGSFSVWRRGEILSWMDDGTRDEADPDIVAGVKWTGPIEDPKANTQTAQGPTEGWWVRLKRANGQSGWVVDPKEFECMGLIDEEADCAGHNPRK